MRNRVEATNILSGDYDDAVDDDGFITFPGELEGEHAVKPLIDTGGSVNIISRALVKEYGIKKKSVKTIQLLNGDGTTSDPLEVILMSWKFDDRGTVWENVKFVVTDKGPEDFALLGLPFLKVTQIIHSSKGQLVFPEFDSLPSPSTKADLKPIYHTNRVGPKKGK